MAGKLAGSSQVPEMTMDCRPIINIEGTGEDEATSTKSDSQECSAEIDVSEAFNLQYLGSMDIDRRYTTHVMPWIVREVTQQKRGVIPKNLTLLVMDSFLVWKAKEEVIGKHFLGSIFKLPRLKAFEYHLAYCTTSENDSSPCRCHVFKVETNSMKSEFLCHLKTKIMEFNASPALSNSRKKSLEPAAQVPKPMSHRRNVSYGGPVPVQQSSAENQVCRFSLYYVGKVTISQPKAPPKFVDDMLRQLRRKQAELEAESKTRIRNGTTNGSANGTPVKIENSKENHRGSHQALERTRSASDGDQHRPAKRSASDGDQRICTNGQPAEQPAQPVEKTDMKDDDAETLANIQEDVKTRLVTFQISMSSVMLFSVGSKQLLLEKKITEISYCTQGEARTDHFGFICREKNNHVLYLFQGESESMVESIMKSMKQAFNDALQATANQRLCELCPLQQFHKLCTKLDGARVISEQQAVVQECLQTLNEVEYTEVMNKFNENMRDSEAGDITLIVSILRGVFDRRQQFHKHTFQTGGTPTMKDLREGRDRSKSTFLEKAKKSLTNSFESLMARRARAKTYLSSDSPLTVDTAVTSTVAPYSKRCLSPNLPRSSGSSEELDQRPRSRTYNSCPPTPDFKSSDSQEKFVIPDQERTVFEANQEKAESHEEERQHAMKLRDLQQHRGTRRQDSWRKSIYYSVTRGSTSSEVSLHEEDKNIKEDPKAKARERWRKAIMEQILLIRMERENKKLAASITATETRRQKLNYEDYSGCNAEAIRCWDDILQRNSKEKVDDHVLLAAVRAGVPKYRRGEIWKFLIQQHMIRMPDTEDSFWKDQSYESLVEQPTGHQHAILIDLGRTFPSHEYFTSQLGAGQLSLFNILKAYSLLDEEVGYCQGLSFIAGLFLMHMSEQDSFESFRHLMFKLGIRNQYKPDMTFVQQQLYQLSRLLHDCHPSVYEHFNNHDVTPTLYAAPWFLTLFVSQYPVGFVSRIMDLVLLQGLEVIFKVALVLVGQHSAEILEQDSFENIVEYLKDDLPEKVKIEAEDIITRALDMDIKHQLNLFEVEYQLLHEEMIDIRHNKEKYEKQEMTNQNLVKEVENLKGRLQEANERIRGLESALLKVQLENEMLKSQLSKTNSHCLGSNAARCDRDLLASEGANLTEQAGSGRSASVPSALLSPTSSEVENIMNCVNNKRDCEDGGRGSDEKSWELVPSPSTVNREMDSVLQRIQSLDSDSDPSRTDTDSDLCGSADSTNACNDKKNEQVKEKRLSVTKKRPALPNLTTTILPLESP